MGFFPSRPLSRRRAAEQRRFAEDMTVLRREVAEAGINLDLVYVATHNRVVFGSPDIDQLKTLLGQA